jgi:hypothetical protein
VVPDDSAKTVSQARAWLHEPTLTARQVLLSTG